MSQNPDLFVNLALDFVIAIFAWRHYRKRLYGVHDKYLTFWPRFWTVSVDSIVLWPVATLTTFLPEDWPAPVLLPTYITLTLVPYIYSILLHARYGQTIGKMVCRVKVVDWKTERKIRFGQALLRDAIPLLMTISLLIYQTSLIIAGKLSARALVRPENLQDFGISLWLLFGIPISWFLVEVVTMLTNNQRRALHDFVASTVVIRTNIQRD